MTDSLPPRTDLELIHDALDASGIGVWSWQVGQDAIQWNRQMFELFDRVDSVAPADYGAYLALIDERDRESVMTAVQGALDDAIQHQVPGSYRIEHRVPMRDGSVRWLECRGRAEVDASGNPVHLTGSSIDVTAHKRLEEQLIEASKYEALARFSAHVAHDFNNLLTVILGSADLLDHEALTVSGGECVTAIRAAAEQASELTRGMLLFARRNAGSPRILDATELLEQFAPVLRRALGRQHQLFVEVEDEPLLVRIDASQAQLLLVNLLVNARHAMPEGGAVYIALRRVVLDKDHPDRPADLAHGEYASITVRDEGVGIPPDVLPLIFEPFFTTRPEGQGTGLGLAACQGIVAQAGGTISVVSKASSGTTFTVLLPLQPGDRSSP